MTNATEFERLQKADKNHHFHAMTNPIKYSREGSLFLSNAEGIYVHTSDGKKVIDGMSGLGCVNIGYGNERLCRAAYQAMQQLSYGGTFGGVTNPWAAALSEKMAEITPDNYQHFFFASTGSDAVESAIKMTFFYWRQRGKPGKRTIIARELGYHGHTIFATHLAGSDLCKTDFGFPLIDHIHHVDSPYWYRYANGLSREEFGLAAAASLERKIEELGAENIAAFIAEPIQATYGLIIPPRTYWPEIQRICNKHDILLIADEVVTGFGKTGHMFGFDAFDFQPDLFTMAKGLSSGYYPISSVGLSQRVSDVLLHTDTLFPHGFTNCGHPVGAAVALENIAVIQDEGLLDRIKNDTGPHLAARLAELLVFPCVGDVNAMGLMGSIEIDSTKLGGKSQADSKALGESIGNIAFDKGLSIRPSGTTMGILFPMIITRSQIDDAIEILKETLAEVCKDATSRGPGG